MQFGAALSRFRSFCAPVPCILCPFGPLDGVGRALESCFAVRNCVQKPPRRAVPYRFCGANTWPLLSRVAVASFTCGRRGLTDFSVKFCTLERVFLAIGRVLWPLCRRGKRQKKDQCRRTFTFTLSLILAAGCLGSVSSLSGGSLCVAPTSVHSNFAR